jgi:antitoxin VapB
MSHVAKLFLNGRSQAVRLPASYRFDCKEVYIRQDALTGDVILSRKPDSWQDFFDLVKKFDISSDFMEDRQDTPPQERDLF